MNRKRLFSLTDKKKLNPISTSGTNVRKITYNVCGRKMYGINKRKVGTGVMNGFLSVQRGQIHICDSLLFAFLCNRAVGWSVENAAPGPRFSSLMCLAGQSRVAVTAEHIADIEISRATLRCSRSCKSHVRSHSAEFIRTVSGTTCMALGPSTHEGVKKEIQEGRGRKGEDGWDFLGRELPPSYDPMRRAPCAPCHEREHCPAATLRSTKRDHPQCW